MSGDKEIARNEPLNLITILSIDGGGIRGVIPATILSFLEDELKKLENKEEVRLADYFDVIAGTSTGAIITATLTAPVHKEEGRPFRAKEIVTFFSDNGRKIFSKGPTPRRPTSITESIKEIGIRKSIAAKFKKSLEWIEFAREWANYWVVEPRYDGHHLRLKARNLLGETLLKDTLTNVVIPTYDINNLRPKIFTTRLANKEESETKLSDVVVSSASAPYYFPPHTFIADGGQHKLVDGGLFANNPVKALSWTMFAIKEATKQFGKQATCTTPRDYSNYLILSLGTGKKKHYGHHVTSGGIIDWFGSMDVLLGASEDIAEMDTSFILGQPNSHRNYLRIQDYELEREDAVMDDASPKNVEKLKSIAEDLIEKYVAIPNLETGLPDVISSEVDEQILPTKRPPQIKVALSRFARRLYDERRSRMGFKK